MTHAGRLEIFMESLCQAMAGEKVAVVMKDHTSLAAVFATAERWVAAGVLPSTMEFNYSRMAVRIPGAGAVTLVNGARPGAARGYDRRTTAVEPGVDA